MNWKETALQTLKDSLHPIPTELNGIDWKSGLSCKTERLAQHLSAFANNKGGGFLVFGVNNDGSNQFIDRAVEAIEKMFLPAPKITKGEQYTKVTLFPRKDVREMTKAEKVRACYQHACLMYEDYATINNQSIRERFELNKNKSSIASRIIADTLEAGLIKISDADIKSKKYATYIPYYG